MGKAGKKCPQTYKITYDCMGAAGLKAQTMVRTVKVVDTTKPKVTILGSSTYEMEAGFTYNDAGATATDTLDGDITNKIYVDGNTINTRFAYTKHTSCNDVKAQFKNKAHATDGFYTISTKVGKKEKLTTVWCHMGKAPLTFSLAFSWRKIRPYYSARGSVCGARGLDMLKYDALTKAEKKVFGRTTKNTQSLSEKMRKGKYVISYYVQDKAGNHQRAVAKRTVVVKDTLPPVITLRLKGNLIQTSASNHRAVHDKSIRNPAKKMYKAFDPKMARVNIVNKFPTFTRFMAETSSVNGWIIAAAASAVTGVALLSFSTKKQTM